MKDTVSSGPVKVENRGAWSLITSGAASRTTTTSTVTSESSNSLWHLSKTQEQQKKQRVDTLAAQQHLLVQARERENAQKQKELEEQRKAHEKLKQNELEAASREAAALRETQRAQARSARESEMQHVDLDDQVVKMSTMEAELNAGGGSFLD